MSDSPCAHTTGRARDIQFCTPVCHASNTPRYHECQGCKETFPLDKLHWCVAFPTRLRECVCTSCITNPPEKDNFRWIKVKKYIPIVDEQKEATKAVDSGEFDYSSEDD